MNSGFACFIRFAVSLLLLNSFVAHAAVGTPSISAPTRSTSGSYSVSWSAGSGDKPTRYELIGEGVSGTLYSGSATYSRRGPLADGTYYYRVRACNASGCSGYSSVDSTRVILPKPPGTPSISAPTSSSTGSYSVSWSAGSGEKPTSYQLIGEGVSGTLYSGSSTYSRRGPLPDGTYYYRVKACNSAGCSGYSSVDSTRVTLPKPPGTPTISAPTLSTTGSYTVSWQAGSGATPTRYEVAGENISGHFYTGTATSSARGPLPMATYYYKVRACNAAGCSGYSAVDSTRVAFPKPGVPSIVNTPGSTNNGYFTLNWQAGSGETPTRFEVAGEYISGDFYSGPATSSYRGPLADGSYYYKVRACSAGGCSDYSSPVHQVVVKNTPKKPQPPQAVLNGTTINLSWQQEAHADNYKVEVKFNDRDWQAADIGDSATLLSHAFTDMNPGTRLFRIVACNGTLCSTPSSESNRIKIFEIPGIPSIADTPTITHDGYFTLNWQPGTGGDAATRYEVAGEYISGNFYSGLETSSRRGPLADGSYYYKVRACNEGGCSEYSSPVTQVKVLHSPGVPAAPLAELDGSNLRLSWQQVDHADNYKVEVKFNDRDWQLVEIGSSAADLSNPTMSHLFTDVNPGTRLFRVTACNGALCSLPSPESNRTKIDEQGNNIEKVVTELLGTPVVSGGN
ncbi:hypothetical protein [Thalassomonas sp. RHCl1]|uniref:hypothetical protein n=1 Tax=Thalassomonas sp. RHCl1 TaxID=2995320 RepID=UPI00248CB057|nr:hypothetical protein [Thalassomonas sp. RHCl1]